MRSIDSKGEAYSIVVSIQGDDWRVTEQEGFRAVSRVKKAPLAVAQIDTYYFRR